MVASRAMPPCVAVDKQVVWHRVDVLSNWRFDYELALVHNPFGYDVCLVSEEHLRWRSIELERSRPLRLVLGGAFTRTPFRTVGAGALRAPTGSNAEASRNVTV